MAVMGNLEMTGLFPRVEPCTDCPESELAVYRRLKESLPSGWTAWHSLKIRTKGAQFSEADFVVANPSRGILVLEVKGGLVKKERGVWLQNGLPMRSSPLDQAHRFVRNLIAKFKDKGLFAPPIGVAVVFPDTDFDAQPTQGDVEGLVIGARELPYLEEALPRILDRALREHTGHLFAPDWLGILHGLWCESWPLGMSLSQSVKGHEARRIQLDKEQFTALESILENDLVLVRGGAGTGKTLLARELAIREARAGRAVLLLTFTDALGLELARHIDQPGICVSPVGRFALEKLRQKGFEEPERYEPEFWDGLTRMAAQSGDLWDECGFDTVIVDEGQDFGENEWAVVEQCAGRAGLRRLWVFADDSQAFWEDRRIPSDLADRAVKFSLRRPYRCPPGVQAFADAYVEGGWGNGPERLDAVAQGLADGTLKVVVSGDTEAEAHAAVGREIRATKKEGFAEADIAVVSLRGMMYPGNVMHNKTLGRCELAQATDLEHRDRVICDTFLRYKGLERPVVLIVDILTESSRYPVRMNIAASRAFGALRVVASSHELEKDPILCKVVALQEGA
jgi:hypothetical protein